MAPARVVRIALVAVLLCGVASPAAAQRAGGAEIAGGYQLSSSEDLLDPQGWFLSGGYDLTRVFAVVAEVSEAGDRVAIGVPELSDFGLLPDGEVLEVSMEDRAVMGGVRAAFRRRPIMLFSRFLIGMERFTTGVSFFGAEFVDLSDTGLSVQVGGGLDIDITEHLAVRILGDWRRTRLGGEPASAFLGATLSDVPVGFGDDFELPMFNRDTRRFAIGAVYRFGR